MAVLGAAPLRVLAARTPPRAFLQRPARPAARQHVHAMSWLSGLFNGGGTKKREVGGWVGGRVGGGRWPVAAASGGASGTLSRTDAPPPLRAPSSSPLLLTPPPHPPPHPPPPPPPPPRQGKNDEVLQWARSAKAGTELAPAAAPEGLAIATVAGGCFWGLELAYQRVPGVVKTSVGYTAGQVPNPT